MARRQMLFRRYFLFTLSSFDFLADDAAVMIAPLIFSAMLIRCCCTARHVAAASYDTPVDMPLHTLPLLRHYVTPCCCHA